MTRLGNFPHYLVIINTHLALFNTDFKDYYWNWSCGNVGKVMPAFYKLVHVPAAPLWTQPTTDVPLRSWRRA